MATLTKLGGKSEDQLLSWKRTSSGSSGTDPGAGLWRSGPNTDVSATDQYGAPLGPYLSQFGVGDLLIIRERPNQGTFLQTGSFVILELDAAPVDSGTHFTFSHTTVVSGFPIGLDTFCDFTFVAAGGTAAAPLGAAIAARVELNFGINVANGSFPTINWESTRYDTASIVDLGGQPTRLTAPEDGIYIATLNTNWAANSTGNRFGAILKNGSFTEAGVVKLPAAVSDTTQSSISLQVELSAGDYLEAQISQNSGGNLVLNIGQTWFAMAKVGNVTDPQQTINVEVLAGTKSLATGDDYYQFLDGGASDRDVVLSDPPSEPDAFLILNEGTTNDLLIKETGAGPTQATLTPGSYLIAVYAATGGWRLLT